MADLTDIVRDHALWLDSGGQDGRRAHFAGESLEGQDFTGLRLTQANFRGANLTRANFTKADVMQADFSDAVLAAASFQSTQAAGAVFKGVQARGMRITESDLSHSVWHGADASEAELYAGQFMQAELRDAVLDRSQWRLCQCHATSFRGAHMAEVRLMECDLGEADLRDARVIQSHFSQVQLAGAECRNVDLTGSQFEQTDLLHTKELDPHWHQLARGNMEALIAAERATLVRDREKLAEERKGFEAERAAVAAEKERLQGMLSEIDAGRQALSERGEALVRATEIARPVAKTLMTIAGIWFAVAAMVAVVILYQVSRIGVERLRMAEIGAVLLATILLLFLHISSGRMTYQVARMLERVKGAEKAEEN